MSTRIATFGLSYPHVHQVATAFYTDIDDETGERFRISIGSNRAGSSLAFQELRKAIRRDTALTRGKKSKRVLSYHSIAGKTQDAQVLPEPEGGDASGERPFRTGSSSKRHFSNDELRLMTDKYVFMHWRSIVKIDPNELRNTDTVAARLLASRFDLACRIFYDLHIQAPSILVASSSRLQKAFNALDLITTVGGERWFIHQAFWSKVDSLGVLLRARILHFSHWELGDSQSSNSKLPKPGNVLASLHAFLNNDRNDPTYSSSKDSTRDPKEIIWSSNFRDVVETKAYPTEGLYSHYKAATELKEFWRPVISLVEGLQATVSSDEYLRHRATRLLTTPIPEEARSILNDERFLRAVGRSRGLPALLRKFESFIQRASQHESFIDRPEETNIELQQESYLKQESEKESKGEITEEDEALFRLCRNPDKSDSILLPYYRSRPETLSVLKKASDFVDQRSSIFLRSSGSQDNFPVVADQRAGAIADNELRERIFDLPQLLVDAALALEEVSRNYGLSSVFTDSRSEVRTQLIHEIADCSSKGLASILNYFKVQFPTTHDAQLCIGDSERHPPTASLDTFAVDDLVLAAAFAWVAIIGCSDLPCSRLVNRGISVWLRDGTGSRKSKVFCFPLRTNIDTVMFDLTILPSFGRHELQILTAAMGKLAEWATVDATAVLAGNAAVSA